MKKEITLEEAHDLLLQMNYQQKRSGYLVDILGQLVFFSVEPLFGGVKITKDDILEVIDSIKERQLT